MTKMNWRRNKKSFFSISWLLNLKKEFNGRSEFKKIQESHKKNDLKNAESFSETKALTVKDMKNGRCSSMFGRFAVMTSSVDPENDFRDSMVQMITENKIVQSGELEELLACYLTLNHDEYHHLIIKVFKDIWFQLLEERASSKFLL